MWKDCFFHQTPEYKVIFKYGFLCNMRKWKRQDHGLTMQSTLLNKATIYFHNSVHKIISVCNCQTRMERFASLAILNLLHYVVILLNLNRETAETHIWLPCTACNAPFCIDLFIYSYYCYRKQQLVIIIGYITTNIYRIRQQNWDKQCVTFYYMVSLMEIEL